MEGKMEENKKPDWLIKLEGLLESKPEWMKLLSNPSGAAIFEKEFPKELSAKELSKPDTPERQIWELVGLFYRAKSQWHDAIAIYMSMYKHMLNYQTETGQRVHKGMPLVWLADCFNLLGYRSISKKYLMLTLVEDAIESEGTIDPSRTGVYFRLTLIFGLSDYDINSYATRIFDIYSENSTESRFPEWILQELDQDWLVEVPDQNEISYYTANEIYIGTLMSKLGDNSGKALERLAEYILSCIPGWKTFRRMVTQSTDYDVVCSIQGPNLDFRSELGRYFLVECKDISKPVDFSILAKFCRVLDSVKAHFGIIFSPNGISGEGKNKYAEREQFKVFQDRGLAIIVINRSDLNYVAKGGNFIALLKRKYEKIRLDLSN